LDVGGGRQGPAPGVDEDLPRAAIRDADRGRLPARPLSGGAAPIATIVMVLPALVQNAVPLSPPRRPVPADEEYD